jgi:hypothetical protein
MARALLSPTCGARGREVNNKTCPHPDLPADSTFRRLDPM